MTDNVNRYDAIVIGSGIGGLAAAALLAKLGNRRVLVLERHFQAGGQTHSFVRKGRFHFDVGLHYLGQMAPGDQLRNVMDFITGGRLDWNPMPPVIERFVYPDMDFPLPTGRQNFEDALTALFPAERAGLRRYFGDLEKAGFWFGFRHAANALPPVIGAVARGAFSVLGRVARMTTREYMDTHFTDNRLKALLCTQWPDFGLPPGQSAFGMHAIVAAHYLRGGWYPVGGARRIAEGIIPEIEKAGGAVRTGITVEKIIVNNGAAEGVVCRNTEGTEEGFRAPLVISDAGAWNTYLRLLPPEVSAGFRDELESFPAGYSAFVVYLGLKASPKTLGFDGGNVWVYDSYDHDDNAARWDNGPRLTHFFLSFPSLKDPEARAHTAEVATLAHYEDWERWAGKSWRKRETPYYDLKKELAEQLLAKVEKRFPGFRGIVEYHDVSTPLTMEYFQGNRGGAFYGIPCVPRRLDTRWCGANTPVKGLYLAGADAMTPGIAGAMMGGVMAVGASGVCGGMMKVMGRVQRGSP